MVWLTTNTNKYISVLALVVLSCYTSTGQDLVAFFPFDGSVTDQSTLPNLAQNQGVTFCPDRFGQPNKAVRFDVSTDRILVPQTSFDVSTFDAITISFWMRRSRFDYPGYNPHIVFLGDAINYSFTVDAEYPFNTYTPQNRDLLMFYNYSNQAPIDLRFHPTPVSDTDWHFVTFIIRQSENSVELFLDSNSNGRQTFNRHPLVGNKLSIGNHPTLNWAFEGDLDEFRIHNRALSQSEITTLMQDGATVCTNNLLANASFTTNLTSWSGVGGTSQNGNLELCQPGQIAYQTIAGEAGKTYQFQYTAQTAGTNQNVLFGLKFLSASWHVLGTEYSSFDSPGAFGSNFIQKVAPAGTAWVEVSIAKQNSGCVQVSEVCLTKDGGNSNPCMPDVTAPVVVGCPSNRTETVAQGSTSAASLWTAPVFTDNCTTNPTISASHASGQQFPLGNTTVSYQATDASGNVQTCSFVVSVVQASAGVCTNNLLINASFDAGLANWNGGGATAATVTGASVARICTSGQRIYQTVAVAPGKTYTLEALARSESGVISYLLPKFLTSAWSPIGQQASEVITGTNPGAFVRNAIVVTAPTDAAYLEISVFKASGSGCTEIDQLCLTESGISPCAGDVTPPVLTACPANITQQIAAGVGTAVAFMAPTATDNCPGVVQVNGSHASGAVFPVGTTTVLFTATDASNNTSTCSFTINVSVITNSCAPDNIPPVLTPCPASQTLTTSNPSMIAQWTAPTATDNCPGTLTVIGSATSGQAFAVGATTVTYTARDASNNTSTCSFIITVQSNNTGTCANNLLANASFATNLNNWNGSGGTWQNGNLELCTIGQRAYQTIAGEAGKTYQFHYTAQTIGTDQNVFLALKFLSSGWSVLATEFAPFDSPGAFANGSIQKLAPSGTAWVEVSIGKQNNGCIQVSEVCLTTLLQPLQGSEQTYLPTNTDAKIYPNPASEYVLLDCSDFLDTEIEISFMDINGRIALHQSGKFEALHQIQVNDLQSGLYLVRIASANQRTRMHKLVVEQGF